MKVDDRASGGASNVNGVLEAGERVTLDPAWRNSAPATEPLPLTGSASNPTGAPGPTYTLEDSTADYGTIASGLTNDCFSTTGNCYEITVSGTRPAAHWDATFDEALSSPEFAQPMTKTWALHVGGSFPDVPQDAFYPFIENLFHNRVTAGGGCGAGRYCGDDPVLRQQMAVFLLKSAYGAHSLPPAATGGCVRRRPRIESLRSLDRRARPHRRHRRVARPRLRRSSRPIVRRAPSTASRWRFSCIKDVSGGHIPCARPATDIFDDVPCSNPFAHYIEYQFNPASPPAARPIPHSTARPTRPSASRWRPFLVKTFGLELYGPD